jgi:predicted Rossmann fold nucleotide-binding protein DprA/Smf involved in DNA uptake
MTMHPEISPETQAVLLLCGHFAPKETSSPLELRELNRLVDVVRASGKSVSDLLDGDTLDADDWRAAKLDRERVLRLLERGAAMALAVERWTSAGLWIVARGEDGYPARLKQHLGRSAPALLFGVGDAAQLERGGLAIVGSRDVDEAGRQFTDAVARQCAREDVAVVSGGARGVDEIALAAAFEEGGRVVAVLPEGLGKASVAAKYRSAIREERLVLLSPYAPHAPFSVGNAMGRNRLIYALADAALVVASAARSGGTWAGAEEELKRENGHRVYVREAALPIDGNEALLKIGGVPFPEESLQGGIRDLVATGADADTARRMNPFPLLKAVNPTGEDMSSDTAVRGQRVESEGQATMEETLDLMKVQPGDAASTKMPDARPSPVADALPSAPQDAMPQRGESAAPKTAYDAILPLLIECLQTPRTAKDVAEALDVAPAQAKKWLDRAVEEKRITKSGRPAKFSSAPASVRQPSLFG